MKLKKALSGILAAAMIVTLTPAMAFATTTNTISGVSTVAKSTEFTKTVEIAVKGVMSNWAGYNTTGSGIYTEELTLNVDGAKWLFKNSSGNKDTSSKLEASQFRNGMDPVGAKVTTKNGGSHAANAAVAYCSSNSVTLTITNASSIQDGDLIQLTLNLKSGTSTGDITLSMSSSEGDISSLDSRTIATVVSGKTVASVPDYGTDDLEKIAVRTAGMATSDIQIKEVTSGCLGSSAQSFSLTLPSELSWATVSGTNTVNGKTGSNANVSFGGSLYTSPANPVAIVDPSNDRVLLVSVTPNSTTNVRRTLTISPKVNTSKDVKEGEVSVTLRGLGSSDITDTSDLVIATVGTSSISVFVDEEDFKEGKTPVLQSGISYKTETVGTNMKKNVVITLEENNKDSFTAGKWVDFTFDKKVQLAGNVTVEVDGTDQSASLDSNAVTSIDEERSSFGWQVAGINSTQKNKVKVYIPITVEAGYEGDITCTVSGDAAGVTTSEVVVAKAAPVITVSATPSDVRAGVKNQDIGDVVITETEIGALKDSIDTLDMPLADADYYKGNKDNTYNAKITTSELVVKFPFALKELPTVDVTDGDLDIKDVAWTTGTSDKKSITIEIKSESVKNASTITISGLKVTLDRTPAEGGYAIDVYGSAILQNAGFGKDKVFADAYSVKDAINVVTPADSTTVSEKVQAAFVIGEASYTNNGAATEMDAAPYIDSHNRTMVPIRYVANACGISENDIRWEQNTQTAIINGLNTVVTVKMGSNKLQTSAGEITMDTAAVNNNGRIYVPVRYIANALGANVSWDAATKTVTLTK